MEKISKIEYVIGMDGGGTKTSVLVANLKGEILFDFKEESINYNGRPRDVVDKTLARIMNQIKALDYELKHCKCICIGTAGISNLLVTKQIKEAIKGAGYHGNLKIFGDHEIALAGALKKKVGIIVIAGTGSICFGVDEYGASHRSGGFGYLIDDVGGGYYIGSKILTAVVRMEDGRGKPTILKELLLSQWKKNSIPEVITFLYQETTKKQDIAALAPLLSVACQRQDSVAMKIAAEAALELKQLVIAVLGKLEFTTIELAVAGSVFIHNQFVREHFIAEMKQVIPEIKVSMPLAEPVYGAVLLALQTE